MGVMYVQLLLFKLLFLLMYCSYLPLTLTGPCNCWNSNSFPTTLEDLNHLFGYWMTKSGSACFCYSFGDLVGLQWMSFAVLILSHFFYPSGSRQEAGRITTARSTCSDPVISTGSSPYFSISAMKSVVCLLEIWIINSNLGKKTVFFWYILVNKITFLHAS